ncbi:hypothetical protein [Flavobacterium adhaerens]|uniref:hypothetical protein n=1 Tax=Flavobacterium adhaerens TaxID=3149043 RepID=UPI0032B53DC2
MQYKKTKINLVLFFTMITSTLQLYSQTNTDPFLYSKFDSIVGKENIGLNNGPYAYNPYKVVGDYTMFFKNDKFSIGTVVYTNQPYHNIKLKYDVYKDQLILNPAEKQEYIGITLIKDKIDSFSIYGKNFVNLRKTQPEIVEFQAGFHELINVGSNFQLYIRHHKDIQKRINDEGVNYKFTPNNKYFIDYNFTFYEVNSKSSILKIFPVDMQIKTAH